MIIILDQKFYAKIFRIFIFSTLLLISTLTIAQEQTFGDTVDIAYALKGEVYHLSKRTRMLPDFSRFQPMVTIYTQKLDISPRSFIQGFPGVKDRFEWFGIKYTGKFHITNEGEYEFLLNSDDGSILYIDGKMVIDNDGLHGPLLKKKKVKLIKGFHSIRVDYFQGPAEDICLELKVVFLAAENNVPKYFNTYDFAPFGIEETKNTIKINLPSSILFASNSFELRNETKETIEELLLFIKKTPFKKGLIVGHTDSFGSDIYNKKLSKKRAEAVFQKMKTLGLKEGKFEVKGKGENAPIVSNATENGRKMNRRVEVVLLK